MTLPKVDQAADISGKKVFVRGDIDVPLVDGKVSDDTRLRDIWPTVEFLLEQKCQIVLGGHVGRPEGEFMAELSSRLIAQYLANLTNSANLEEQDLGFIKGFKVNDQLTVLENLRFYPGEEANDPEFAKVLASTSEIYVNEAFAVDEREHASTVGVPKLLPHFAGFRLCDEMAVLSKVLDNATKPLVVIIGGAKLETKIPLISTMEQVADYVIVGGKLLAEIKIGSPIMAMEKVKILRLTDNTKDITLESIDRYSEILSKAGTIVWNGPMGQVEEYTYQVGTRRVAELVAASSGYKIVGGGDTVGILQKLGLTDKFDWVCSGGGSMLKFLAGEKLPGVEALLAG